MAHPLAPPQPAAVWLAGHMIDIPFDPEDPPVEPPPDAPQPLLWSVARQVFGDHDVLVGHSGPVVPPCRLCDEPWPCRARRIAERALLAACRPAQADNAPIHKAPIHQRPIPMGTPTAVSRGG